jgi:hypothetical protein
MPKGDFLKEMRKVDFSKEISKWAIFKIIPGLRLIETLILQGF